MEQPNKKPRLDKPSIKQFFSKRSVAGQASPHETERLTINQQLPEVTDYSWLDQEQKEADMFEPETTFSHEITGPGDPAYLTDLSCPRCKASFDDEVSLQSHEDWHFAKDIQDSERVKPAFAEQPATSRGHVPKGSGLASKRGRANSKREQGQSKLTFG
jgi:DNA polymerase eta